MQKNAKLDGLLLILMLIFFIAVTSELQGQTLPLDERIFVLSKTYESVAIYFAHWEDAAIKPEQLDNVYKDFLKKAITTENRKEFALLMSEFFALLRNSHSWYWDYEVYKGIKHLGFSWIDLDGEWVVIESYIEGLKKGDLIVKVNEKAINEWYKEYSKYINASSERSRRDPIRSPLALFVPDIYFIEFINEKGELEKIQVDRGQLEIKKEELQTEGRWIEENKVGYIKIPSFGKPEFENRAIEFVKEFKNAKALIIDVRGNRGGSTPGKLIDSLMDRPYRWWAESIPISIWNACLLSKPDYIKPKDTLYNGKLIILTDRVTGSAAEDFVVSFKDNKRATIIGEATAGSTGQPYTYNFGKGITIGIGAKRACLPDGSKFEGIGIEPDIEIRLTREDLYKNSDRVLEKAVEFAGE